MDDEISIYGTSVYYQIDSPEVDLGHLRYLGWTVGEKR